MAALEASTGLKLVDRRARIATLTEDGKRIAAVAAPMEEAAFAIGRAAQAAKPGVEGEVTISAPPNFASALIAPQLVRLRQQHPGIRIKLIGEKRTGLARIAEKRISRCGCCAPSRAGLIRAQDRQLRLQPLRHPRIFEAKSPRHAFAFIGYDASMAESPQRGLAASTIVGGP